MRRAGISLEAAGRMFTLPVQQGQFSRSRYPKEGLRGTSMGRAPPPARRLSPWGPVPRIAGLCRAGLIDTLAPKTATYEYRAAHEGGPVFLGGRFLRN